MLPNELNETPDDVLFALVDGAVLGSNGDDENLQPLAPFLTLEILRRVHERIVHLKKTGCTCATKHKLIGRAILLLTGMPVPPDERDVDKIGNHLDIWLTRRYIKVNKKLCQNVRNGEARDARKALLQAQCFVINGWGGVSDYTPTASDAFASSVQRIGRAPHVPFTQTTLPPNVSLLELKDELNEARWHRRRLLRLISIAKENAVLRRRGGMSAP